MIVLETTRPVVESAEFVHIDPEAVRRWAGTITADQLRPGGHSLLANLPGNREQIANLVLLIDALNFCFWGPQPSYSTGGTTHRGFNAMLAAIIDAARRESRWFGARFWCDVPSAQFRAASSPAGDLPMLAEREEIARQTGRTLLERFDGQFAAAVESVNHRAWDLAALLLCSFDSFRDVSEHRSRPVFFAKRAQIAALDLSISWAEHGYEPLSGLEQLTAFADYRLPQALRHLGIVGVSPELAERIEGQSELEAGSPAEVELRAATVVAVEEMRAALAARGQDTSAWQIDWHLWNRSHDDDVRIAHHRTRTIYY
jgi:hypothetical protein